MERAQDRLEANEEKAKADGVVTAGERAKLRYGGDGEPPQLPDMPRDKLEVELIDLYRGPLVLDAQGQAVIEIPAPDFDGTLDVTALVFADDRFGRAHTESIVRQAVVAQLSAPRAMAPASLVRASTRTSRAWRSRWAPRGGRCSAPSRCRCFRRCRMATSSESALP